MAIGDRITLADKETLDAVDSKVGTTSDSGGTTAAGTLMGKLNAAIGIITNLYKIWTAQKAALMDAAISTRESEVNALARYNSISTNTGPNDTASATGSLSQKLSYIINQFSGLSAPKYPKSYRVEHTASPMSNVTIVNVSGPGWLEFMCGTAHQNGRASYVQVIVDGVDITPVSNSYAEQWIIHCLHTSDGGLLRIFSDPNAERIRPLHFSKSLVIKIVNDSTETYYMDAEYAVYE